MLWSRYASRGFWFTAFAWLFRLAFQPKANAGSTTTSTLKFTHEPTSRVFVQSNREFVIDCEASGRPLPTVSWTKDGVYLKASKGIRVTARGGLHFLKGIRELGENSHGIYRCVANNTAGVLMSKKVRLDIIYVRNISVRVTPPLVSGIARLECIVSSNQPVTFTWLRNNATINATLEPRITNLPSGVLQINYKRSDDGDYSCRAENGYESITSAAVKVHGQSTADYKLYIYPHKNISVQEGSQLVIECVQTGFPQTTLSWNKIKPQGSGAVALVTGTRFVNLIFYHVRSADAGEYRCKGRNGSQEKVVLSVNVPPRLKRRLPPTTTLRKTEKLTLSCEANGNPLPSVTWYKDGKQLTEGGRVHFMHNKMTLVVDKETSGDRGVYQCEAENYLGSEITYSVVDVKDTIAPPYDVRAYPVSPTIINVTWRCPPGYPSNAMFYVHYQSQFDTPLQDLAKGLSYVIIKYLKPYTKYLLFVQVFFPGNSQFVYSKQATVKTLEKEPNGPPLHVELKSYSRGTLDVTWLPPPLLNRNGRIVQYTIKCYKQGDPEGKIRNITLTKSFYSYTLKNLEEGKKYTVRIAAKTSVGLGPFSQEHSCTVSRKFDSQEILAPPKFALTKVNSSFLVSVNQPQSPGVNGYRVAYTILENTNMKSTEVSFNTTTFRYLLKNLTPNAEYVIYIRAVGVSSILGRPAITVVATVRESPKLDAPSNLTNCPLVLPLTHVTCRHANNSTALVVKWAIPPFPTLYRNKYRVKYFMTSQPPPRKAKFVFTEDYSVILSGLLPGATYDVEIESLSPRNTSDECRAVSKPESGNCVLPEISPGSPPSNVTCIATSSSSSVVVRWRPPTEPNGKIMRYRIIWRNSSGKEQETIFSTHGFRTALISTLHDVQITSKFVVSVFAKNSAGESPRGECVIDTTLVKRATTRPTESSFSPSSDEYDDIKLGIIIGCVISLLFVAFLVVFVMWSDPCGCRTHKPLRETDVETTMGPESQSRRRTLDTPGTISTEVSEVSGKHYQILQKYYFEEASKESDRGLGMTPKNSRLCLASEKTPMLQNKENQENSADTSFDSQDSGIQGFAKLDKGASSKGGRKTPHHSKSGVRETMC